MWYFRCFCYSFVILLISVEYLASQIRQEGAVFNVCNPKYAKDCYAMTKRLKRGEPYKTNFTATFLQAWHNNVTIRVVIYPEGFPIEIVKTKFCDIMHIDWLYDYILTYSLDRNVCPILPGLHGLYNIEVPPRKLPQSIKAIFKGKVKVFAIITKTEEIMSEITLTIHM